MSLQVYIDGKLLPKEEAKISVFDHGLLYGDGVFEGIRVYGKKVFLMQEHIDRLYESALAIRLEIPLSKEEMIKAVNETVAANGIEERAGDCWALLRLAVRPHLGTTFSSLDLKCY